MDQQCRDRYLFAGLQGGQRIPRKWLESGATSRIPASARTAIHVEKARTDRLTSADSGHTDRRISALTSANAG